MLEYHQGIVNFPGMKKTEVDGPITGAAPTPLPNSEKSRARQSCRARQEGSGAQTGDRVPDTTGERCSDVPCNRDTASQIVLLPSEHSPSCATENTDG